MRIFTTVATAVCLSVLAAAAGFTAAPSAMTPAATAVSDAAAKKHAKRTACLKEAKSKKLIGAEKTSFLKNCIAAP